MKFLAKIKLNLKFLWVIASNSLQKTYFQHLLKFRFKGIKKCRSGNLSRGKMSGWGFVAVRNCPGGKMSAVGNCPAWENIWVGNRHVGCCPVGNCRVGNCRVGNCRCTMMIIDVFSSQASNFLRELNI